MITLYLRFTQFVYYFCCKCFLPAILGLFLFNFFMVSFVVQIFHFCVNQIFLFIPQF
jgi:hypothetical protein